MAKAPKEGWHRDPQNPVRERYWDGGQWTDQYRDAPPVVEKRRRRGGTVMKVMLGVILGGVVLIAGCAALISSAADEAIKDLDAEQQQHAITKEQFDSVSIGTTEEGVIKELGKQPEDAQEFTNKGFLSEEPQNSSCIYYNRDGGEFGDVFQFCFDGGKLNSKNSY